MSDIPVLNGREEVEQAERIFSFIKDDRDVDTNTKQLIALALFVAYKNGITKTPAEPQSWSQWFIALFTGRNNTDNQTLAPDEEKANLYLAFALGLTPPESGIDAFLAACALLTSIRLGGVRLNRVLTVAPVVRHLHTKTLTPPYGFFSTLQLSYGPELLACLVKLVQKCFRPETNQDRINHEARPWYQKWVFLFDLFESNRFKQIVFSREFANTFTNAFVWFLCNIYCYVNYPMVAVPVAIANLISFGFDIWHDSEFPRQELEEYTQMQDLSDPALPNEIAPPLHANTKRLVGILGLSDYEQKIKNSIHTKINGSEANWNTGIKYKGFRTKWVAIALFVAMIFVYMPVLAPVFSTWLLPALAGTFISPILPFIPGVSHWLSGVGAILVMNRNPELYKTFGVALTVIFGVLWGSLGARLRGQINWNKTWETSKQLVWNIVKFAVLSVIFYVATAHISVPFLILGACAVPIIPILWGKNQTERAEKAAFDDIPDNLPIPALPITKDGVTVYRQLSDENIIAGALDIREFQKLTSTNKIALAALRKASGLKSENDWVDFLKNLSKPHLDRDPSSTKTINEIIDKIPRPVASARETKAFGRLDSHGILDLSKIENVTNRLSDDDSVTIVRPTPAPPSSPNSMHSTPAETTPTDSELISPTSSNSVAQTSSSSRIPLLEAAINELARADSEGELLSPTFQPRKAGPSSSQYELPKPSPTGSSSPKATNSPKAPVVDLKKRMAFDFVARIGKVDPARIDLHGNAETDISKVRSKSVSPVRG